MTPKRARARLKADGKTSAMVRWQKMSLFLDGFMRQPDRKDDADFKYSAAYENSCALLLFVITVPES